MALWRAFWGAGCRGLGGSGECPRLCPASSPHARITSFTGDGRKYKPPPARAADSIESCRNRSPCPGSIQGNINYPKTKTRGVHSWGPTLQILPPSAPPSLLPCCSSSLCTPAIYTVSLPKCLKLGPSTLGAQNSASRVCRGCAGILQAEMVQGLDLCWEE